MVSGRSLATGVAAGCVLLIACSAGDGSQVVGRKQDALSVSVGDMAAARAEHTSTPLPNGKVLVAGGRVAGPSWANLSGAELFDPQTGIWTATGPMGVERYGHTATLLASGKVLVVGGFSSWSSTSSAELYDPSTGTWSPTGSSNGSFWYHAATLLPSGKVLVVGKYHAELYDPATGSWTRTSSPNSYRLHPSLTLLPSGKVLLVGGHDDNTYPPTSLTSTELYDPATGTWSPAGSLRTGRSKHTTTLLPSGQVLVAGGYSYLRTYNLNVQFLASAEIYDPPTRTWIAAGSLSTERAWHTATLLPAGKVLVVAGQDESRSITSVDVFDSVSGTWATAAPIHTSRKFHAAALLGSGKVLLSGGYAAAYQSADVALASSEVYDLMGGASASANPLQTGRSSHTETLLQSGQVLVVGGLGAGGVLSSAEQYEPATGRWASSGELRTARASHTATLLRSGKLLVAGGTGASGALASAEVYSRSAQAWSDTGSMGTARTGHTATLLSSGNLLVVGGTGASGALSSAEVYVPSTGSWVGTGALSTARARHTATLLASGAVLVVGGQGSSGLVGTVEVFDPTTGQWASANPLTTARAGHVAVLLPSGKVLVAGGVGAGGTSLASAEVFDPSTGAWTATASLGAERAEPSATLLPSGKIVVSGGQGTGGVPVASVEVYDPSEGTWRSTMPLAVARRGHAASILPSGDVLITGGSDGSGPLVAVDIYQPAEAASTASGALLTARNSHTATLLPSGRVLIAGGLAAGTGGAPISDAEVYDPSTGTWSSARSLASPRARHTATLLHSGRVLVVGGLNAGNPLASAELYEPATGTWSATGSLAAARQNHTATLLASGQVLVAGGYVTGPLASAELYDPARGTWSATGPLTAPRTWHTATLLPSGKVLVAGGYGTSPVASAELYDPATGTWTATAPLSTARAWHTASLLPSGKVLVAGGYGTTGLLASAEVYDPTTETWSATGSMSTACYLDESVLLPSGKVGVMLDGNSEVYDPATGTWSGAAPLVTIRSRRSVTLLPSGKVLFAGGENTNVWNPTIVGSELYDEGRGAQPRWTPGLSTTNGLRAAGGVALSLTGTLLTGLSEGSGGTVQSSAANYPLVRIERQESQQTAFATVTAFTSTSLSVTLPTSLLPGWHWLRVIVNGVPSAAQPIFITPPVTIVPTHATVAPKQSIAFTASGGTGSGRVWTLLTNASGGSIDLTSGLYVAGATGGVTDIVQVTDSSGGSATGSVDVTAGVSVSPGTLSLSPKGGTTFTASGGSSTGFTWSLTTNASGGSIASDTGAYVVGPTGSCTDVVQVKDSLGNLAQATVSVTAVVAVTPVTASAPPRGSLAFAATGGSGTSFTWSLTTNGSGGTIDPSSGSYVAGPTGATTDVIQVKDSLGNVATRTVTVTAGVGIAPATASVAPRGQLAFTVSGGSGTGYVWSLVTNASGGGVDAATGAYTAGPTGSVTDVVQVVDSLGNTATRNIAVTAGLGIAPTALSLAPRAARTLTVSGGSGTGYAWSLATNASGGTIDASTGAYSAGSTGSVTDVVQVVDSLGNTAMRSVTVTAGVSISPASASLPPRGPVTFGASGGSGSGFVWSLPTNASGATIDAATGAYTAGVTGSVTDVVQVKDSLGNVASLDVSVSARVGISPAVASAPPRASITFTASSGSGSGYTWKLKTNGSGGAIDSNGVYTAGSTGSVTDVVEATDSLGNTALAEVTVSAGVSVTPPTASVAPRASRSFTATGGSGSGFSWSLTANASGGTIDPSTGAYVAGPNGATTDVVQAKDSLGNVAQVTVSITAGVSVSPASASAPPKGSLALGASGGSGTGYTWSLFTNASGASLDATTGAYTAGITGSVTDVVHVVDSLGNTATQNITVTPGLGIAPATLSLAPRAARTLTVSGGSGTGYAWSLTTNASGGSIDSTTGAYVAGPTPDVTDIARVTDSLGNVASLTIAVTSGVSVAPASVSVAPRGTVTLAASGGTGAGFAWELQSNASGGTVSSSGVYTAGAIGGVTDVIRVTDSVGNTALRQVSVTAGVSVSPTIATLAPKAGTSLVASGGSGAGFSWSFVTNASGGSIASSTGAYVAGPVGEVTDLIQVRDSLGNVAQVSVTVTAGLVVSPASASTAPRGSIALAASGGSGVGFAWSLATNASGATIDAATGAYTAGSIGSVTDVVQVIDSLGNVASRSVTVTEGVGISPLQASAPPRGSLVFTASGGKGAPYTWTLSTNASGGAIDSATGVYTAGHQGNVTDVVRVKDALGSFAQREVTVTANLGIEPAAAVVARGGRIAFAATGGSGMHTWSLAIHSTGSVDVVTGVYTAGSQGGVKELVTVTDSVGSTASCEVTITEDLAVAPSSATVPPKGRLSFVASAGSGRGYAWSLASNGSGGTIDAASGEYTAGATGGVTDVVRLTDSVGNLATVNVTVSPGLALSPETTTVPPKGRVAFSVTGGSGTGFVWSLSTNASGGTIDATSGGYAAGPSGGVTDVVEVTDSLGNRATRSLAVTASVAVTPLAPTVASNGTVAFAASGGSGTGFSWSLSTNASGGSIDAATGLYTAGPTPQVTDVVEVTDSLGNVATTTVAVAAELSPVKGGCGCQSTSEAMPLLAMGLVALLRRRRALHPQC